MSIDDAGKIAALGQPFVGQGEKIIILREDGTPKLGGTLEDFVIVRSIGTVLRACQHVHATPAETSVMALLT